MEYQSRRIEMAKPPSQSSGPEPLVHRSLGLGALLQQLDQACSHSVLDLGGAVGANLDFWSPMLSRIVFEDFYRTWEEAGLPAPEEGGSYLPIFSSLFSAAGGEEFDIVLAWDLLNYLEPEQIRALASCIGARCRPGAILFAMVASAPLIPNRPATFRILDREHLVCDNRWPVARDCPRYQPRDVSRLMPGFEVINSFLLRHGVHEYLFACQNSPDR